MVISAFKVASRYMVYKPMLRIRYIQVRYGLEAKKDNDLVNGLECGIGQQ